MRLSNLILGIVFLLLGCGQKQQIVNKSINNSIEPRYPALTCEFKIVETYSQNGKITSVRKETEKRYFDGLKYKADISESDNNKKFTSARIYRLDLGKLWYLDLKTKMYSERDYPQSKSIQPMAELYSANKGKKFSLIGTEKVLGYDCDIYKYPGKVGYDIETIWISKALNQYLKRKLETNSIGFASAIEETAASIKKANLDSSIFEIPSGYTLKKVKSDNYK